MYSDTDVFPKFFGNFIKNYFFEKFLQQLLETTQYIVATPLLKYIN